MSQRQGTINRCDVCGHEWLPNPIMGLTSNYTHCTSGKCRSRLWNGSTRKAEAAVPVEKLLQQAVEQAPEGVDRVDIITTAGTVLASKAIDKSSKRHNPNTCRVYLCGMCASAK